MIRLFIDQTKCAGCGICAGCNPDLFEIDTKRAKAGLKQQKKLVNTLAIDISTRKLKEIKEIAHNCPAQAIKLSK